MVLSGREDGQDVRGTRALTAKHFMPPMLNVLVSWESPLSHISSILGNNIRSKYGPSAGKALHAWILGYAIHSSLGDQLTFLPGMGTKVINSST